MLIILVFLFIQSNLGFNQEDSGSTTEVIPAEVLPQVKFCLYVCSGYILSFTGFEGFLSNCLPQFCNSLTKRSFE